MKRTSVRALLLCTVASLLLSAGCATRNGAIITSFQDITSGTRREGCEFVQTHAASINGLLPFSGVGELYFYPGNRGIYSAVGVSSVLLTNRAGAEEAEWRAQFKSDLTTNANGFLIGRDGGSLTATYNLVREYASPATLNDLRSIRTGLVEYAAAVVKSLRLEGGYRAAALNTNTTAAQLEAHRTSYSNAVEEARTNLTRVIHSLATTNLVLFQWTAAKSSSGSTLLGSLFSASRASREQLRGFALVAGLRTTTLHAGADLIMEIERNMADYSPEVRSKLVMPTFTVQGRQILYFAESELAEEIQAKLKTSYSQVTHAAQLAAQLDQIELQFLAQKLQSLSNAGTIVGPTTATALPVKMYFSMADINAEAAHSLNWATFFSVLTSTKDIQKVYRQRP